MPTWAIAIGFGLGGFLAGSGFVLLVLRARLREVARARHADAAAPGSQPPPLHAGSDPQEAREATRLVGLLEHSIREPLARLRRVEGAPTETLAQLERLAWQARMLAAPARPMQARPTSPIALLEQAAERVDLLRLGKVPASWTLRCRQPVYVDAERAGAAFREILQAAAEAASSEGRLGIRILPGEDSSHPVRIEVEVGLRGSEPDALALSVARRLLEAQGARVDAEGPHVHVQLRAAPPEPVDQTSSNK